MPVTTYRIGWPRNQQWRLQASKSDQQVNMGKGDIEREREREREVGREGGREGERERGREGGRGRGRVWSRFCTAERTQI